MRVVLANVIQYSHVFPKEVGLTIKLKAFLFQLEVSIQCMNFLFVSSGKSVPSTRKTKVLAWASPDKKVYRLEFAYIYIGHAAQVDHLGEIIGGLRNGKLIHLGSVGMVYLDSKFF